MKKGITFYFGYHLSPEDKARLIAEAGFDCVMTSDALPQQNSPLENQVKFLKKYNLSPSSLHMRYKTRHLPRMWKRGAGGERLKELLIEDVLSAAEHGFKCVVVHAIGRFSKIGKQRFLEVLDVCEKHGIPLAFENLSKNKKLLIKIFENIDHPYLKACFDCGHQNIWFKKFDFVDFFGDKLITLHLHDNCGRKDDHTINRFGTIDWKKIADKLRPYKDKLSLDYELLLHVKDPNQTAEEFLAEAKAQADELERMIEEN
ncbi:MAG: sugar phosphate isomerase/epimerase [Clostridia bacterium]|nr:sugar phosphate isomerase/epimerase [Clostridia bacterium]